MEKHYLTLAYWFSCGLCDGMPANRSDLEAWEVIKKTLLHDERAKRVILEVEEIIEREGYRG